jgi:hypothetical protein
MQLVGGLEEIPAWGIVLAAAGDIAVAAGVGFYFAGVGVALLSAGIVTALLQGFSTLPWPPLGVLLGFLVFFLLAYPLILRKGRPLHLAFRKYLRTD